MRFMLLKVLFNTGTTGGVQAESVTPIPLSSVGMMPSTAGEISLSELILQASVTAAVSCTMLSPMPTTAVTVTTSPVSTPLPSSVTPSSLFDSPLSIFSATEKEMPARCWGSSSGIADDGGRLGDDLYLPTINWDPIVRDKRYEPRWKIAESSRLIFPPMVQHWVERAYPPS
ncbi:hypothetical protein Hanom_Chr15g01411471 [Helianthus anomalus]